MGFATHNRAGEILYTRIAPYTAIVGGNTVQVYTYSFTIIHYTDHGSSIADRCEDTLYFGDGKRGVAPRVNSGVPACSCGGAVPCGSIVINDQGFVVKKSIYTIIHTYGGPGNYYVHSLDPNRNQGVYNIQNSVNQPFYIESLLIINSFTGANSSPVFKFDPTDRACVNRCFYHDPGAYDPDGDSLSYEISTSRGADGNTVAGYFYPPTGGGPYGINAVTGILTWCTPQLVAEYNLAFIVKEWRKNTSGTYQVIGYVLRDMQVIVLACSNNPPNIVIPSEVCVEAGTLLKQNITITDPENNFVEIIGGGGAFATSAPIAVLGPTAGITTYTTNFTWQTACNHIRQQPYICTFKAEDQQAPVKLVYFTTYSIKVVPPSVKNVSATPIGSTMKITWALSTCNPANNVIASYKVYRKNNCDSVVYDPCKTGADPSLGYTYIGQTTSTGTVLIDNNSGNGLVVGQDYSYLVVAVYTDGSQSFASTQVCSRLKRDVPIILNVDILSTSATTGSVYVRWDKPLTTTGNFDTLVFPGPYQFNLKYKAGPSGTYITVFTSTANSLNQLATEYYHVNLNTVSTDQEYMVEFIAGTTTIGSSQKATSVFLSAIPGDRKISLAWTATTPWDNYEYTVFRKGPGELIFSAIGSTVSNTYLDDNGIANRFSYCYKILSKGRYSDPSIIKPLLNNSQEVCVTAKDLTIPCAPTITITADCPVGFIKVEWNNVALSCSDDVIKYILFKKETVDAEYEQIAVLNGATNTSFTFDKLTLISNCFAIQSIDSSGNASILSPDYCVDNCPEFDLPNIVTINGDGVNDFFKAIRVRQIKEIDLNIFDRWGNLVYKTKDPYFKWDGVSIITDKPVSEGTFFYICDVFEPRVTGIKKRNLKGFMQVVR